MSFSFSPEFKTRKPFTVLYIIQLENSTYCKDVTLSDTRF